MANGEAMRGLCDIVTAAGATLVGIGCAVEKGFQGAATGSGPPASTSSPRHHRVCRAGNIVFRDEE